MAKRYCTKEEKKQLELHHTAHNVKFNSVITKWTYTYNDGSIETVTSRRLKL